MLSHVLPFARPPLPTIYKFGMRMYLEKRERAHGVACLVGQERGYSMYHVRNHQISCVETSQLPQPGHRDSERDINLVSLS